VEAGRLLEAVTAHGDASLRLARVEGRDAARAIGDGEDPLELAFDHDVILATAVERIRGKLLYTDIGFELLGPTFTLRDLRLVYEAILQPGRPLNKDSFRRTMLDSGLVERTGEVLTGVGHRPPALYRFRPRQTREV